VRSSSPRNPVRKLNSRKIVDTMVSLLITPFWLVATRDERLLGMRPERVAPQPEEP
jgi:hypothetical protein